MAPDTHNAAFTVIDCADRDEWLNVRSFGIGGSDASAVMGDNPYKTNIDLFEEKIGRRIPEDISDKPYVKYGVEAESHIRALFALDYPEYTVTHHENRILRSKAYPFMQASLDGELVDKDGRRGILEIKTTNILQSMQREKWDGRIPQNYFIQILHYMLVTGWDFAVLCAHLRTVWPDDRRTQVKHYFIERQDPEIPESLEMLLNKETEFWQYVESGRKPALVLPEIQKEKGER